MKKLTSSILEIFGYLLWGFRPKLMKDVVEIHGPTKSITWLAVNMPKYEIILKQWGPERTHLMAVAISGINGCPYCTYGHALSFQLHYFKNRDQLFPIDEQQMMNFNTKNEQQIVDVLSAAYDLKNLTKEKKDLERFIVIKNSPEMASTKDDLNIKQLIKMFNFLNNCGIKKDTSPDFAHDPINRDSKLYERYNMARTSV